jgi:hypothetical protein
MQTKPRQWWPSTVFEGLGVLEEITGRKRDRIFSYTPYVALFQDDPPSANEGNVQETEADVG